MGLQIIVFSLLMMNIAISSERSDREAYRAQRSQVQGVLIKYQDGKREQALELIGKNSLKSLRIGESLNYIHADFADDKETAKRTSLSKICKNLKKDDVIISCRLNRKAQRRQVDVDSEFRSNETCDTGLLGFDEVFSSDLLEVVSTLADQDCHLFGEYVEEAPLFFTTEETEEGAEGHRSLISPFWYRERTGADLLEDLLEGEFADDIISEGHAFILDFGDHQEDVNLVFSDVIHGVDERYEQQRIVDIEIDDEADMAFFLDQLESGTQFIPPGSILNFSMGLFDYELQSEAFRRFTENHGAILVQAAGNDYPMRVVLQEAQSARDHHSLLVGSVGGHGLMSIFSQGSSEVTILAPGENYAIFDSLEEEYIEMGGNSFSAPMVSAALVQAQEILDNRLNVELAQEILRRSSFPSIEQLIHDDFDNFPGSLNAYRLMHVSQRIAQVCLGEQGDHKQADQIVDACLSREVLNDEHYQFSLDVEILNQAKEVLPGCASDSLPLENITMCDQQKEILSKLRAQIFLSPLESMVLKTLCWPI